MINSTIVDVNIGRKIFAILKKTYSLIVPLVSYWRILICYLLISLFTSQSALAREWMIMLVPDTDDLKFQQEIEQGLSLSLGRSLEQIIDRQQAFNDCQVKWCGQTSIDRLFAVVREKSPSVQLLLLYSLKQDALEVKLIDPLSYELRLAERLDALKQSNSDSVRNLSQDMGLLLAKRLDNIRPEKRFTLNFTSFLFEELNGLPTFVLSNNANSQLQLKMSSRTYIVLDHYFPVHDSQYDLVTLLSASQVKQSLKQFFEQQSIEPVIEFSQDSNDGMVLTIQRQGNPYAPSFVTNITLFGLFILIMVILLRRQYLDYYLQEYARSRQGNDWLDTYQKARFQAYFLRKKWQGHVILWERLCRDSNDLANQAKIYFDASDVNTAKLFISKALYTNANNKLANELMGAIERLENDSKALSDNEQWIRNKIAKAMNNYRQNLPFKALKQLYQAYNVAGKEKSLKKQTKAIKKLIKQINNEFGSECRALIVNCSSDPISLIICQNSVVHLGRMPSRVDNTWISSQDSVHYLNHRSVSRVGQQCHLQNLDSGFYVAAENSKNGTFLNDKALLENKPKPLSNKDSLRLGGEEPLMSVNLKVSISDGGQLLQLRHDVATHALLSRTELNKLWPDNALAVCSKLSLVRHEFILSFDLKTQLMIIQDPSDNRKNKHKNYIDLCIVHLGEKALISPLLDANELHIDSVPLNGEVPLLLPCTIRYEDTDFQFTEYNNASVRYSPSSYLDDK